MIRESEATNGGGQSQHAPHVHPGRLQLAQTSILGSKGKGSRLVDYSSSTNVQARAEFG